MTKVIVIQAISLLTIYCVIMLFGYFTFTQEVDSDVLKTIALHAKDTWYLKMVNILMIVLIICHFPVTCYGSRAAAEELIFDTRKPKLWQRIIIVFVIIAVIMCVSFFVSEVADVLDITSSLAGSFVIYIIPAAF